MIKRMDGEDEKLNWKEYVEIGMTLKEIRKKLMDYGQQITNTKSKGHPARKHQEKALKYLDETRNRMEDVMFDDLHNLINLFDAEIFTHVFYGTINDERLEQFLQKNSELLKLY